MAVNLRTRSVSFPAKNIRWGFEQYYFASQGNDFSHDKKADTYDGSGFGDEWKNEPPGMKNGKIKLGGNADLSIGAVSDIMDDLAGQSTPVNFWYTTQGISVGDPIVTQPSYLTDHSIKGKVKDGVVFDSEWSAAGGVDVRGRILGSPLTLLSGASGTGPVVDNTLAGGATFFGGAFTAYLWTLAGGTDPTVALKVQHCDTEAGTYTDLAVFDTFDALGSARVELDSTKTIQAFLKLSWTITGTPTEVQVLVGGARGRNPDA